MIPPRMKTSPSRRKIKRLDRQKKDFESDFTFVSSQKDYMKDTWNDLAKYVKKKARTNLDEKIAKVRKERKKDENYPTKNSEVTVSDSDDSSDEEISDDELVEDRVKVREGDLKRKTRRNEKNQTAETTGVDVQVEDDQSDKDDYFDSVPTFNESDSFYTMNLSRPLLKAIEELRYVHPTPIQAATIP